MSDLYKLEQFAREAKDWPPRVRIDDIDKAFIAAASPETVLKLIRVTRAAAELRKWGHDRAHEYGCGNGRSCDACEMNEALDALKVSR